jgi:flagellar motor switch/type III secretory pathway protein FliN
LNSAKNQLPFSNLGKTLLGISPVQKEQEHTDMGVAAQSTAPRAFEATAKTEGSGPSDQLDTIPWLPCTLSLDIPVVRFTIQDLLSLKVGSIVETAFHQTSDIPLRVNGILVGWTEFDVIGDRLAVRVTEQA